MTEIFQRRMTPKATPDIIFPRVPVSIFSFDALTEADEITLYLRWEVKQLDAISPVISEAQRVPMAILPVARGHALRFASKPLEKLTISLDGQVVEVPVNTPEPELFEGLNTLFATVQQADPARVADWANYHAATQGAEAALLLNRVQRDETSDTFCRQLAAAFRGSSIKKILVVDCPAPLGARAPDARSKHMAPDAPGRARLAPAPVDPWTAPFFEVGILRPLLDRFLRRARAVLMCDTADLMLGEAVFDRAIASAGYLKFAGRHAYPYSLQGIKTLRHAHHTTISFDGAEAPGNLCFDPRKIARDAVFRQYRIEGLEPDPASEDFSYYRCVALKHPGLKLGDLVPKSSLVRDAGLDRARAQLPEVKIRSLPAMAKAPSDLRNDKVLIVTTMKNEGPFILEWLAYHRAIGVTDFLVYTNDCTDGTDTFFDLLQSKGLVTHRKNPFRQTGERPQHAALFDAQEQEITRNADWVIPMDVDEFINIHTGDGTLADLFAVVPDATMIALTWRLFGNADIDLFEDRFITDQFVECAPKLCRKPHQAWGFKTAFRTLDHYRKFGVHRPKGLKPEHLAHINWVNGSGAPMPKSMLRSGWRSSMRTIGYDLVTLNHYSLRSAESFLVKRDRGRVNHVDRDQGLNYWFRMNHNKEEDRSIQRMLPRVRLEFDRLMGDPEIAAQHAACVTAHRARIVELMEKPDYLDLYQQITGARLCSLSRMLEHFGTEVFLKGPDAVPADFHLTGA